MPGPIYFDASFGGIPLLITKIDTEGGRDVVVQSPSRGDKHVLQDRGKRHAVSSVEILFTDQPGLEAYTTRYDKFRSLVEGTVDSPPQSQIFSHPLDGSYRARASELRVSADSNQFSISVSCTIHAEDEPVFTFPVGGGSAPAAGLDAVTTAASDADAQLAAVGLSTTATADAVSIVTSWSTAIDLDSQAVFVGVASLTQEISDAIDTLDLASNLDTWTAYQAMVNLHFQVARAGEAFTSNAGQLFQITVMQPRPLLAIAAEVYGADHAQDRSDQLQSINRVRTPGLVPKGTVLKCPPRSS